METEQIKNYLSDSERASDGMKYFTPILTGFIITLGGGVLVASAQGYVPLVTLPGVTEAGQEVGMGEYLAGMMKFIIALAGVFAILMAIIGGTQYVAAGISPDAKSGAKERMTNAFIGLALVLVSYLILNSINPNLVKDNFTLPPITGPVATAPGVTATTTTPGAWPSDATERAFLASRGVTIQRSGSCTAIGQPACTSLYNLPQVALNGVAALKAACGTCSVVVNGGTEYWLHRTHGSATSFAKNVDLDDTTTLNAYIRSTGTQGGARSCGIRDAERYFLTAGGQSGTYVFETHHWHVCY